MNQGMFIAFEGIDGSGKSTQISKVSEAIREWNKYQDVVLTREPTHKATEIAEMLKKETDPLTNATKMAKLFVYDRKAHYHDEIFPDILKKRVVLCDRYTMSTIAYQSVQGRPMRELIHAHIDEKIGAPDITVYLALTAEQANERISSRGKEREKFEQNQRFIEKLVNQYETIYNESLEEGSIFPRLLGEIIRIYAPFPVEEVTTAILQRLEPIYKGHKSK